MLDYLKNSYNSSAFEIRLMSPRPKSTQIWEASEGVRRTSPATAQPVPAETLCLLTALLGASQPGFLIHFAIVSWVEPQRGFHVPDGRKSDAQERIPYTWININHGP